MPTAQQRALNKKLSQIFRMRGLTVRPDAMPLLYDFLETDEENWEAKLQALLAAVQREPLKDSAVDGAVIRKALGQVATQSARSTELPLEVIDAFAMTAVRYAAVRQAFLPAPAGSLHGPAESKQTMLALRLHLLEQRLKRNKLFKPPALSHGVASKEHIVLTHLDALLGRKGSRVVLGLLTEKEEGQYYLEDTHSSVPLDLSQAETQRGFFTRNACVLMEGEVQPSGDTPSLTLNPIPNPVPNPTPIPNPGPIPNRNLHPNPNPNPDQVQPSGDFLVATVGLPPYEARADSVAALAGLDLLHPPPDSSEAGGVASVASKPEPAPVDPIVEQEANPNPSPSPYPHPNPNPNPMVEQEANPKPKPKPSPNPDPNPTVEQESITIQPSFGPEPSPYP